MHPRSDVGTSSSRKYDVFVSHRGPDTKRNFVELLLDKLRGREVFVDKWGLEPGVFNWDTIKAALRSANLVLVVLSPRYQESAWCMEELSIAVEEDKKLGKAAGEKSKLRVVCFGKDTHNAKAAALEAALVGYNKHPQLGGGRQVQDKGIRGRWLEALECTAKIVGWRYDNENESLLDLVNDVFKDLESNLPPQPLDRHSRDKVGVAERVEAILGRPGMQKAASVRVLGLWGMGGIGKTTLAVALFDKLTSDFAPATCFVAEVRSHMEGDGPTKLQHQMLKELWDRTAERPPNILQGQNSLKDKLNKKVLLVLDDVEEGHVEELLDLRHLVSCSVVILASRNKAAFELPVEIDVVLVELLDDAQAALLFQRHVGNPEPGVSGAVVKDVLAACGKLPLTLMVVGRRLKRKGDSIWQGVLARLQKAQPLTGADKDALWSRLKISYDDLDIYHQRMFLDIACFALGKKVDNLLPAWGAGAALMLENLEDKCLLSLRSPFGGRVFVMHDQLRDMGRAIAKQQATRVWGDNAIDVIRQGSATVECISLPSGWDQPITDLILAHSPQLRLLDLGRATWDGTFKGTWNHLVYMESHSATALDSLPCALVVLDLSSCWALKALPESVGNMASLQKLDLSWCVALVALPESLGGLTSPQTLNLSHCKALKVLPDSLGTLTRIQTLDLGYCEALKALPESLSGLTSLQTLDLHYCEALGALPESVSGLTNLQTIHLGDCVALTALPESLGSLASLQTLDLRSCEALTALPKSLGGLTSLQTLDLRYCGALTALALTAPRESPHRLTNLQRLHVSDCDALMVLDLDGCMTLESLKLDGLLAPHTLKLDSMAALKTLDLSSLTAVQTLILGGCLALESLDTRTLVALHKLELNSLASLQSLDLSGCEALESLTLGGCLALESLKMTLPALQTLNLGGLTSLQTLNLGWCKALTALPESIGYMASLQTLDLRSCDALAALPESLGGLTSLLRLDLSWCKALAALPESLGNMESLQTLDLSECEALTALPVSLGGLTSLQRLYLGLCKALKACQSP